MESTSSNGIAQQEQVSVDTAALLLDKPRLFKVTGYATPTYKQAEMVA